MSAGTSQASDRPGAAPSVPKGRMGTGLGWSDLAGLTALSVVLFVVWPTLLWNAPRGASHVGRFAASYLAVIPLAAAMLYYRRRHVPLRELAAAVLIVWSVKMLVTVGLYDVFAARRRTVYDPPAAGDHFARAEKQGYIGVPGFRGRTVDGDVTTAGGLPAEGAWVYASGLRQGLPLFAAGSKKPVHITIEKDRIVPSLLIAGVGTTLHFTNAAAATVVLAGEQDGRTHYNAPVVPGERGRNVRLDKAGVVRFLPRVGPDAGAFVVVVTDNPYFTKVGADGKFSLENLPDAPFDLAAVAINQDSQLLRTSIRSSHEERPLLVLQPDGTTMEDGTVP